MKFWRIQAAGLGVIAGLLAIPLAFAQECPEGAHLVRTVESGEEVRVYCKCNAGWEAIDDQCVKIAPLPEEEFLAVTGEAFNVGGAFREYAEAMTLPVDVRAKLLIALRLAEEARYSEALRFGEEARFLYPDDPILADMTTYLSELNKKVSRKKAGYLSRRAVEPGAIQPLPLKAQSAINLAALMTGQGDYDRALSYLEEARQLAPSDSGIRDALVYVRQLRVAQEERRNPEFYRERYQYLRESASFSAAWTLGLMLSQAGNVQGAHNSFQEARSGKVWGGTESRLLDALVARMAEDLETGQASFAEPEAESIVAEKSRAELVLDALEYGKGDWSRSLHFMESLKQAYPNRPAVREAYFYLQGLSAGK